tara:strand:+ start:785 stop:1531 length:747 start_codon:yes stop_codon:yes gene_type:complete
MKEIKNLSKFLYKIYFLKNEIILNVNYIKTHDEKLSDLTNKIYQEKVSLNNLKCSKLSHETEINAIENELQLNASIIIQYYFRTYFKNASDYRPDKAVLINRYLVRKHYLETKFEYETYLKQLKDELVDIQLKLDSFNNDLVIANIKKYERCLNLNSLNISTKYNEIDTMRITIPALFKQCRDSYSHMIYIFEKLSTLNKMAVLEYIKAIHIKKAHSKTIMEIRTQLIESIYDKKRFEKYLVFLATTN